MFSTGANGFRNLECIVLGVLVAGVYSLLVGVTSREG